jgi:glutamine amidotransferase
MRDKAAMIAIVDYGMGNLGSIQNMFRKVGAQAVVTADPAVVARAERLVLPGVGAFDHGMRNLAERGLVEVLNQKALRDRTPVLGVCLGMQLLTGCSQEGTLRGLGWIEGETVRFDRSGSPGLHAMHMGWNTLDWHAPHPLFAELPAVPRFYFVHAFHVVCRHERNVLARSTYGYPFASAIVEGNVVGMQFHPEKSHRFGMAVFRAFAAMRAGAAAEPAVSAGAAA